nr:ABC transporter permease [Rhizobium sp. L1K21]
MYASDLIPPQPAPPPPKKGLTWARVIGVTLLLVWAALFANLIYMVIAGWSEEKVARYGDRYLSGVWVTLSLVGISILAGAVLSVPVAFARMSRNPFVSTLAYLYVYVFRSTPLLAQLFLIYYGVGSFRDEIDAIGLWWFFRDAWNCAFLSFMLNTAAYQAEILRGAIESVPKSQREAADSLGISRRVAFVKIIMPQALIVALRPYGNEVILMIKGSAIVAIVTVYDLMGVTKYAYSKTFDFQAYLWAAIFYLIIVEVIRNILAKLDNRLTRHLKR